MYGDVMPHNTTSFDYIPRSTDSAPFYGWIDITQRCNLRCPYCYTNSNQHTRAQLELDEIKEILLDFQQIGATKVMISGGEPCLHPDIDRVMDFSAGEGLSVVLVTNGTLLPARVLPLLRNPGVEVQVSLDAVEAQRYKLSRGLNLLPQVLKNLDKLLDQGVRLSLSVTMSSVIEDHVEEIIEFALAKGIEFIHFGPMVPVGRGDGSRNLLINNYYPILSKLYKLQKIYYLQLGIDIVENLVYALVLNEKRDTYCNAMRGQALEVGSDGTVYCCGSLRDIPSFTLGDVKTTGLLEIYQKARSQAMFPYLSVDKLPGCRECKFRYLCCGGCRAEAYNTSGGNIFALPSICQDMKRICTDILRDKEAGMLDEYLAFLQKRNSALGNELFMKYL